MAARFVINIPVADLRREPGVALSPDYSHQDARETQLLFGERVALLEREGEWFKIAALEQPCFDEAKGWHPYIGWVRSSEIKEEGRFDFPQTVVCTPCLNQGGLQLSYGTFLSNSAEEWGKIRRIPRTPNREILVEEARLFLGAPYLWGGRAFPLKSHISSVDCSGLINLLYRAQGVSIPRNAYEQYLKSRPTPFLKPGDPLYLAKEQRVDHVVLKLDDKTFIESPETGKCVRFLTWGVTIWEKEGKIHIFDRPHAYTAYPSTFI